MNCFFFQKEKSPIQYLLSFQAAHLRTHNGDYFVEPSKHHEYSEGDGHPHVVFHRSAVQTKVSLGNQYRRKFCIISMAISFIM